MITQKYYMAMSYTLEQAKEDLRASLERLEKAVENSIIEVNDLRNQLNQLQNKELEQPTTESNSDIMRVSLKELKKLVE